MKKLLLGFLAIAIVVPLVGCPATDKKKDKKKGGGGATAVDIKSVEPAKYTLKGGEEKEFTVTLTGKAKEEMKIEVSDLPEGVTTDGGKIAKDAESGKFTLKAAEDAKKAENKEVTVKVGDKEETVTISVEPKKAGGGGGGSAKLEKQIEQLKTKATAAIKNAESELTNLTKAAADAKDDAKKKLDTAIKTVKAKRDQLQAELNNSAKQTMATVEAYSKTVNSQVTELTNEVQEALKLVKK